VKRTSPAMVAATEYHRFATEAQLQQTILDAARQLNWMVYHTFDSRRSEPGFPDAVLLRGRRCLVLEFKTEKGRVSTAQTEWLEAFAEAGIDARVVRPSESDEVLDDLRRW
jgi:hypothetical protein